MSDLISRQAAIDAINRAVTKEAARWSVEELPSAEPERKWIPISERVPSERGEYLVTVTFEGDTYVECFRYGKPMMAKREVKGECFYDSGDEWGDVVYDTEVIAWMPLPEPYEE